ncbi:pumilio, putative [Entamoeba invadens IP1]|uniref:pumilio, putative n=1 Tax=Entamoeba invadens IP1 TaxID=370355 RepID=UPI0002C3DED3|nr:pumilio, putative [Entamoeba invadens IP1]ELP92998.1 pumilio, putative [Entamoeba invadens IP1]|eukprot:XP_004259769.1 pumilio, putative [Entamoeba invadens IP1]
MRVATRSAVLLLADEEKMSPKDVEMFSYQVETSIEAYMARDASLQKPYSSDDIFLFMNSDNSMFSFLHQKQPPTLSHRSSDATILITSSRLQDLVNTPPSFQKKNVKGKPHNFQTLCKDQQGSRKIQQFIEAATDDELSQIFIIIQPAILDLTIDLFGNYVVQKLLEYGPPKLIVDVFKQISGSIVRLSLNTYGCRVIQKMLDVLPSSCLQDVADEMKSNVVLFIEDQNGNHVIQKFIDAIPEIGLGFIIKEIKEKVVDFSKHAYGCRVVQRLIEKAAFLPIAGKLIENVWDLSVNQYGNYVIQHLVQHGNNSQRVAIVKNIKGKLYEYAMKKYSSNVVEKCLRCCEEKEQNVFVDELFRMEGDGDKVKEMVCDAYANYVVQRIVEMMTDNQRESFFKKFILPYLDALKKNTHAKHLVQHISSVISL